MSSSDGRRAGEGLDRLGLDLGGLAEAAAAASPLLSPREPRNWTVSATTSTLERLPPSCDSHSLHSSRPSIATGRPLREVLGAVLALGAPDLDVEVVGLLGPLAARLVLVAAVHCQPEPAHRRAAGQRRELGIGGQIACQDDAIDVCHGFLLCLLYERTFGYGRGATGRWVRPAPRPARAPRAAPLAAAAAAARPP